MKQMTDFVFVLGTGRCGSTLVHELLCRHPKAGFLSNLEDRWALPPVCGRWNNRILRALPAEASEKGRARFAPSEGYRALSREVSPALAEPARDLVGTDATPWLAAAFRRFFLARAGAQGQPVFVHKFTGYPRAGLVAEILPGARFVHVVRDGRDVVRSWLRMPWWRGHLGPEGWHFGPLADDHHEAWERSGRSFAVLAALAWVMLLDAHDRAAEAVPGQRWLELRLEDLAAAPVPAVRDLATALDLPVSPAYERQVRRMRVRPPTGDPGRALATALGPRESAAVHAVLEPALAARGYL